MDVCDFDCLHCAYADCINDELTLADYRAARERDQAAQAEAPKAATRPASGKSKKEKRHERYMRNREEWLAYQREYDRTHREERRAGARRRYAENREKILERNRAYTARRKAEKAAMV